MEYVRTLKSIYRIDEHLVGERAVDLAVLSEKGYSVPLSFVVTNEAFEQFIVQNKLQARIGASLLGDDAKAIYAAIRELILAAPMPQEIVREIVDGYEGLSIDADASPSQMIASGEAPFVTLMLSTNYSLPPDSGEGIVMNVRGLEALLLALKECWACLFTPRMRRHRRDAEIGERNLNAGVVVQRMAAGDASAEAWNTGGKEITVRSYFGCPDVAGGIGKDEWRLSAEYLKPVYQSTGVQKEMIGRDEEDRLEKVPIGERGERQKLPDREVIELARLAKKASILLEHPVRLLSDVKGEAVTTLLCDRLAKGKRYEAEERIEESPALFAPQPRQAEPEAQPTAPQAPPAPADAPPIPADEDFVEAGAGIEKREEESAEKEGEGPAGKGEGAGVSEEEGQADEDAGGEPVPAPPPSQAIDTEAESEEKDEGTAAAAEAAEPSLEEQEEGEGSPVTTASEDADEEESIFEAVIAENEMAGEEQEEKEEGMKGAQDRTKKATGGERSGRKAGRTLGEAYEAVAAALRRSYEERYRHAPPTSLLGLFDELSGEINLPHEEDIRKLLGQHEGEETLTADDEASILGAIDDFLEQMS